MYIYIYIYIYTSISIYLYTHMKIPPPLNSLVWGLLRLACYTVGSCYSEIRTFEMRTTRFNERFAQVHPINNHTLFRVKWGYTQVQLRFTSSSSSSLLSSSSSSSLSTRSWPKAKPLISPQWSTGSLSDLQAWKFSLSLNDSVKTVLVAQGKQMLHGDVRKTRISPER